MTQSLPSRRALVARATLAASIALGVPVLAGAQQPTAPTAQAPSVTPPPGQPGVIVVSYFKCSMATQEQFDQARRTTWTPVLDQAVREGRLLGYGELTHAWGDEWNYVHYYTARDETAFHTAWRHVLAEVARRDPQFLATVGRYCAEHKDNIYRVTHVSPPATATPSRAP